MRQSGINIPSFSAPFPAPHCRTVNASKRASPVEFVHAAEQGAEFPADIQHFGADGHAI